jgi:hypothetical protein
VPFAVGRESTRPNRRARPSQEITSAGFNLMPTDPYSTLSDSDLHQLQTESAIPEQLVRARGYRRCTKKSELKHLGFSGSQQLVPCLVMPMHGVDGDLLKLCQIKPDDPRQVKGKTIKYETPYGAAMRLDAPPGVSGKLKDLKSALWITEGIKKADAAAARGLCCIALCGVDSWVDKMGELSDWGAIALKGRTVYIAFDSDVMSKPSVRKALAKIGRFLGRKGCEVFYTVIPSADGRKMGLDDHFAAGGQTMDLIMSSTREIPGTTAKEDKPKLEVIEGGASRPVIVCNDRFLWDLAHEAIRALCVANADATIMVRDRSLVSVVRSETGYSIEPFTFVKLRTKLSMVADWVREEGEKLKKVSPLKDVVESVLEFGFYPPEIPILKGISSSPKLGPNGKFYKHHGFDPHSGYFVTGDGPWPEWEGDGNSAARFLVTELFSDFPFAEKASLANALALLLTPFVRGEVAGQVPLFFINAPMKESGKTVLAQGALCPGTGSMFEVNQIPGVEEEMQKSLLALLSEGQQAVIYDNLKSRLNSETLEACLTSGFFKCRMLGTNRTKKVFTNAIFVVTANHGKLSDDFLRRTVYISLRPVVNNKQHRQKWRHAPFLEWVAANEFLLASAAFKMVETWVDAGRPDGSKRKNSYDRWTLTISGILEACGVSGFMENDVDLDEQGDDEIEQWAYFAVRASERFGMKQDIEVADLCTLALEEKFFDGVFSKAANDRGRSIAFGRAIARKIDHIFAINENARISTGFSGLVFRTSTMRNGFKRYKIEPSSGSVDIISELANINEEVFDDRCMHHINDIGDRSSAIHLSTDQVQTASGYPLNGDSEPSDPLAPDFSALGDEDGGDLQPDENGVWHL